jgi:hypothetical protein
MSEANGAGGSHLDWLRARHAALKADRTKDMPVPGYDGRVVVRYGPVPWSIMTKLQQPLTAGEPDATMLAKANADAVIAACRDVLVRDDAGELEGINPDGSVRFGPELAALLGADATTARGVVDWLFPSEWAVAAHASELVTWTQAATREDNDALVGE